MGCGVVNEALSRLVENRRTLAGIIVLAFITLLAVLAPVLSAHPRDAVFWDRIDSAPDPAHGFYFGTDANGRDLFTRTLYGGRISLLVGVSATLVSLVIGVLWGTTAGLAGGRTDQLMMRLVDILYALPFMFFVILLMVFFGRELWLIFIAIGAVEWLDMARIVRGQTLALKHREFIEAARAFGASPARILLRHVVPNLAGPVVVFVTLTVPRTILLESFLSFLGLGVQEPMTSWGVLIGDGAHAMEAAPWALAFPAAFLAATLLAFNAVGDGLRDVLDPGERR
jgi:oligopeptide transport system permease protein